MAAVAAAELKIDDRRLLYGVLRLAERPVSTVMTPRSDVDYVDLGPYDKVKRCVLSTTRSQLPVAKTWPDDILGVVRTRELLVALAQNAVPDIERHLLEAPEVRDTTPALQAFKKLRDAKAPIAIVRDEFGQFAGIATLADILGAIVGSKASEPVSQNGSSWLAGEAWRMSGDTSLDEIAAKLGIKGLPWQRDYETVDQLVRQRLSGPVIKGQKIEAFGWQFEITNAQDDRILEVLAEKPLKVFR